MSESRTLRCWCPILLRRWRNSLLIRDLRDCSEGVVFINEPHARRHSGGTSLPALPCLGETAADNKNPPWCRYDPVTLNQRFRWDGLRGFRLFAESEHAHQHSDQLPRGQNVGTRHLTVPLANTTGGNLIIARSTFKRIIDLIRQHADPVIEVIFPVILITLQLEKLGAEVKRCL